MSDFSNLPQPINTVDFYLAAVLIQLQKISNSLELVANELQRLQSVATQKPSIQVQLDTARLAEAINKATVKPNTARQKS